MSTAAVELAQVRVVVVDDTPDIRLLLRAALTGYDRFAVVAEAGDGVSGVEAVRLHEPDVVLLDLAMPVMDGLEALPLMRAASPRTRVVVLSGFESARMGDAGRLAGASAYLQKGASPDEIVATLLDVLGSSRASLAVPAQPTARPPVAPQSDLEYLNAALATAAHELRSPATVLSGLAQTLIRRRDAMQGPAVDELLEAIVRQTRVLDRVTLDLLTSSQSHRGVVAVDVRPMPLGSALGSAAVAVAEREHVRTSCPSGDVWVLADRVRVEQMLGNFVSNALKYGSPPVTISAVAHGREAVVRVADRGPGVPEDFRPRLFQQFSRAHGLRASGTGLGLYVVDSLAQAQDGRAWYEPNPGGGSCFCFSLPLADAQSGAGSRAG